jgi:hypothetical protein
MKPARVLPVAFSTLLAACGGGGSDAPAPELLWQAQASASGIEAGVGRIALRLSAPYDLTGRVTGEACVEGTWSQTLTAAATVRLDVSPSGLLVLGAPVQVGRSGNGGAVVEIPFRICQAAGSAPPEDGGTVSLGLVIRSVGGAGSPLGAYSVTARWSVIGTRG